ASLPLTLVVGYPRYRNGKLYNAAGVITQGKLVAEYAKQFLPNYQVFDEVRYFTAGDTPVVFDLGGIPTALSVCEDIWYPQPIQQARTAGAELMLNLSASPFHRDKQREREEIIAAQAQGAAMPVVYVNLVGAQDELVFDGGSVAINAEGDLAYRAPAFTDR